MTQKKGFKYKIHKLLKIIYWRYLSGIDDPLKQEIIGVPHLYLPSFFKIYTPEEAEEIIKKNREYFDAELKALGEWEESWKAREAGKTLENQKN